MRYMKKANLIAFFRKQRGMTLVEVIVSLAIVAMLALMIFMANGTAFSLITRGVDTGKNANEAYTNIEQSIADEDAGVNGTVSFTAEGVEYYVDGAFYTESSSSGKDPQIEMKAFVPHHVPNEGAGE